ncbi:MAG: RNA-binding protein [Defluviitaleaceae bacterium]|nr:RNA-binding protein [Defluviitaleaceae bacterium]
MTPGQIVFSRQGRDSGRAMIVIAVNCDGEYVYLVDGKLRLLEKPKKKKAKHIQITKSIVDLVPPCGRALQDADIRKHLAKFDSMV